MAAALVQPPTLQEPTSQSFNIEEFLAAEESKGLLRLTTAGSVDDGKSTLIGRLLHDAKGAYEDQLKSAVRGGQIDFSLLTDGLRAEREQGITIDVAYRYFATIKRKFILADTPGHEQYTRNMATGASTAELAIILLDAHRGLTTQSRRHAFIATLLAIPNFVIAVNKMDLVGYDQEVFNRIRAEFGASGHPRYLGAAAGARAGPRTRDRFDRSDGGALVPLRREPAILHDAAPRVCFGGPGSGHSRSVRRDCPSRPAAHQGDGDPNRTRRAGDSCAVADRAPRTETGSGGTYPGYRCRVRRDPGDASTPL